MAFIFRKEEHEKITTQMTMTEEEPKHPLWQNVLFFASMIGVLVFAMVFGIAFGYFFP